MAADFLLRFKKMLHSRTERIQSLIKTEVGKIIDQDLNDPQLPDFITISDVRVSNDLRHALVLITFLQDQTDEAIAMTVHELNHSASFIGRLFAQRVRLKRHPRMKFEYNPSTHYALDMEKIFHQIKREEESMESSSTENPTETLPGLSDQDNGDES